MASLLVGNNLVNIAASSLMTGLSISLLGGRGVLVATAVVTCVLLFGGEILPKSLGRARPTGALRHLSGVLLAARRILSPAVAAVSATARLLLRILSIPVAERRPVFRRQDLEGVFLYGSPRPEREGARQAEQSWMKMAGRALELGRRRTVEAMIPLRSDRVCPAEGTVGDAVTRFRAGGMRYLAAVDQAGTVQGFVAAKALLGEDLTRPIAPFVRPAYVLDPDDPLDDAIQGFRRHQQSIALVRDRDGRSLGLVTTEDLLEEIVGELPRMGRLAARPPRGPGAV
jgi:CBS domain containing-hemolysin-like protein